MSKSIQARVDELEKRSGGDKPNIIIVDWGGDTLCVDGVEMLRSEFERLYPDTISLTWDDTIVEVGIDLERV